MNLHQSRSVLDTLDRLLTSSHLTPALAQVTGWESNAHFARVTLDYPPFAITWEIAFGVSQGKMVPALVAWKPLGAQEWDNQPMTIGDKLPGLPTMREEAHTIIGLGVS
jgi:hypothetical protein